MTSASARYKATIRDGTISVADSMPLFTVLKSVKINGGVQCRCMVYEKLAIVDEYLVHHCWM